MRVGDGFDLVPDLLLGEPEGRELGRVVRPTHLAELVAPSLEGEDPKADEGPDQVIRLDRLGIHKLRNVRRMGGILRGRVDRATLPVPAPLRCAGSVCRQVDEVVRGVVFNAEVGAEPLVRGF